MSLLITPQVKRRLDQIIAAGFMVQVTPGYGNLKLTDKGMAVLLAEADSPVKADELVKPSLLFERQNTHISRVRQQGLE